MPHKLKSYTNDITPEQFVLKLNFDKVPQNRIHYRISSPPSLIYEFYNTTTSISGIKNIGISPVKKTIVNEHDIMDIKLTRFVINTFEKPVYTDKLMNNTLNINLPSEGWKLSKKEPLSFLSHKWATRILSTVTLSYGMYRVMSVGI